ncbi:MAG: anthranilate phosphoribosyltransferase [Nitrososphaeraceae archaeon]
MTKDSYSQGLSQSIKKLERKMDLSYWESYDMFKRIINRELTNLEVFSILKALGNKGESVDEIIALVDIIYDKAIKITPNIKGSLIDICGTGGDKINTFNISTASSIVASAAGCKIAKHGNRSSSGICGSSDFLEAIGLDLIKASENASRSIETIGIGFLFAPFFHPTLKSLSKLRQSIGMRTIFNIVGPLCNPCTNLTGQVIGVYDSMLSEKIKMVALKKQHRKYMIVYSLDGVDELTNSGMNNITMVDKGRIDKYEFFSTNFGITNAPTEKLSIKNREESIRLTLQAIYGTAEKEIEDIVVINSAASLITGDIVNNFKDGIEISRESIKTQEARKKLEILIDKYGEKEKLIEIEKKLELS